MQLLASLHIVVTCSFVVLLAYLFSKVFTYLAHSVIHGSDTSRRRTEGSSRSRSTQSLKTKIEEEEEDTSVMDRLQEEDEDNQEEEEEEDAYKDAKARTATRASDLNVRGGIFDDGFDEGYDVTVDDVTQEVWEKEEVLAARHEAGGDGTDMDNGKGEAGEIGLLEGKEEKGAPSKSMLADAEGSNSLQQRLPPTWSDLERMVNLSSKKHSSPPSVSPLSEN